MSLIEDIIQFSKDYIKNVDYPFNSLDVTEYVCDILLCIYDKKYKQYIYEEIVNQIICNNFPYLNKKQFCFKLSEKSKEKLKERFKILKLKPQEVQRSEEWYKKRINTIGASELASILNKSPFCSRNKYFLKKLGYTDNKPMQLNIYCMHGIKYEEIATMLYSKNNNVKVEEFGSINDEHLEYIAASPDGITTSGTMLEIKCPYSREIKGIPPIYYWMQMQQQLKVCKLNKCDFLECNIKEYNSWSEFINDNYKGDYSKNDFNLEKGVIIEYININEDDPWNIYGYKYPPSVDMNIQQIYDWDNLIKEEIKKDTEKKYSRIIPWKLEKYSCISVFRNKDWWVENFELIKEFWSDVLFYREFGYESFIPKKREKKKKPKVDEEYMFISDSDS